MEKLTYYSPTKIYFNEDIENIGSVIKEYGYNNILFVYGSGSIKRNGVYDKVVESLNKNNIKFKELSNIRANPTIDRVKEGLEIVRSNNINFILAVGGGSVIDTAKSIGASFYYDGDPMDLNKHLAKVSKSLQIGVILTISAAGSELSSSCVIQDDELGLKQGFNSDLVRPLFVFENPELTVSVNRYQTAAGTIDIMMHTFERFLCPSKEYELADYLAVGLLKCVKYAGTAAILNPNDLEARSALMTASSFSHNGITSVNKKYKMPVHFIEHILSGAYPDITHGAGLAVLFPIWCEVNLDKLQDKLALLAKELFSLSFENNREGGILFIKSIREYFSFLGIPTSLKDLNSSISVEKLMNQYDLNDTRLAGQTKSVSREDAELIFAKALN